MGLLDQYESPDISQGLLQFGQLASQKRPFLGLLAGLAAADRSVAGRTEAARQREMEERKMRLEEEFKRAQIGEYQAQAAQRQAEIDKMRRAEAEQQRINGLVQGAVLPVRGIEANAVSGVTGPRPAALDVVGQRKPIDFLSLYAQGVPADRLKNIAEAPTWGLPEVARTIAANRNGVPVTEQRDKFGRLVGDAIPEWKAPLQVDRGGTIDFRDAVTLNPIMSLGKSNTPDALLSASTTRRGQDMTDARSRDANNIAGQGKVFEAETGLRKEFNSLPEVTRYKAALPAYKVIQSAANREGPQSDINLIYGVAKLYDPDSVVREGEYDTIANSQSIPDWLKGMAQKVGGGGRLTPETKRQLLGEAGVRIKSYSDSYDEALGTYKTVAQRRGLDPTNVFIDVTNPSRGQDDMPQADKHRGKVVRDTKTGKRYMSDGNNWVEQP